MTKIVAIAGKKQSGKTTSLNYIHGYIMKQNMVVENFEINDKGNLLVTALFRDEDGNYAKNMGVLDVFNRSPEFEQFAQSRIWPLVKGYNFADLLKEVCMAVFGFSYEQCYGTDEQKNSLTELRWENMLLPVGFDIHFPIRTGNMSAREVMQYFGSDILRRMNPNVWVDSVLRQIQEEQPEVAVIGDCRYKNEVKAIKEAGGLVVKLTRSVYDDEHSSENDLNDCDEFDLVIDNQNLTIEESNRKLLEFLLENKVLQPLNLIGR